MNKQYVFIERSVTVSVNFSSKPLYTQKKIEPNIYTTVPYWTNIGSQYRKNKKKSLKENLTVLKYNSRHVTCT